MTDTTPVANADMSPTPVADARARLSPPEGRVMPPAMATAMLSIMGAIRPIRKVDENTHGSYKYASTDDFFEMVGPLCSAHGLLIVPNEVEWDIRETVNRRGESRAILVLTFEFYLYDATGSGWIPPSELRRSVTIDAGGPQSWGSAQSYAMKQFLRGLFQIPAHDPREEADASAPFQMEAAPTSSRSQKKTARRQPAVADEPPPPLIYDDTVEGTPEQMVEAFEMLLAEATTLKEAEEAFTSFKTGPAKDYSPALKRQAAAIFAARTKTIMAAETPAEEGQ